MAKKIEGLVATDRNLLTNAIDTYEYKGIRIKKNVSTSYRGAKGGKTLAGTYYSFRIEYTESRGLLLGTKDSIIKASTLAEITEKINSYLVNSNYAINDVKKFVFVGNN